MKKLTGWRYGLFIGGFVGFIGALISPVFLYPMLNTEDMKMMRAMNREVRGRDPFSGKKLLEQLEHGGKCEELFHDLGCLSMCSVVFAQSTNLCLAWGKSDASKEHPSNSFFKQVRPILIILRAFGRFPYRMTKEGILPFSLWSIPAIYCFAVYACTLYFSVEVFKILIDESFWNTKDYNEKLLVFILISFLSHNFVVPLTFWLPAPRLAKYIETWSQFELAFQSKFEMEFKKIRNQNYVKYLSIVSIPSGLLHIFFVIWMLLEANPYLTLVFYPIVVVAYMCMILWFTSLYELRVQAVALRNSILKDDGLSELDSKRRCWATISLLTSETGYSQGASCGYLSLSAFVSFLVSIYGFFSSLFVFAEGSRTEWQILLPLSFYSTYFYFMFDRADITSREVGTKFISLILKIRDTHPCFDENNELSLFLLTIHVGQPELTFSGFAVVNRCLIKSLISNTLTFLLVLIQFKS